MIEIIHPGWLSCIVDRGRYGYAAVGIPPSSALDLYAYKALNLLTGHEDDAPVLEVMGAPFSLKFHEEVLCAITGAKVQATLNEQLIKPWTSFRATAGSLLQIKEVMEGFRFYVGFSGIMTLEKIIGSFTTNIECQFGGYQGRTLACGDLLHFSEWKETDRHSLPEREIPVMHSPHRLRVVEGPEIHYFADESVKRFVDRESRIIYDVSSKTNRTGIRLEGPPLSFREEVEKSIISEGILPGTVQIPGDGLPIIMLYERTIGGYARIAMVVKADHDRLAHLKPGDYVLFEMVSLEEAEKLWEGKQKSITSLNKTVRRLS